MQFEMLVGTVILLGGLAVAPQEQIDDVVSCCTPSPSPRIVGDWQPEQPSLRPATVSTEGMAWIDSGTFVMGWDGPEGRYDERPAHAVYVDGCWIDRTEGTIKQFREFVDASG